MPRARAWCHLTRPRVWLIADTHFGHKNILKFEAPYRPFSTIEEHDEALIDRWNSVVAQTDSVWHLGDVLFGRHSFAVLPRLHGRKKLVLGNHDHYSIALYLEHFAKVFGAAEIADCVMTHVPVHPSQLSIRYRANIHGHLHSLKLDDPKYICVSAEQNKLTPILLDEIIARIPNE